MLGGLPLSHTADSEPKQDAPCGALGLRIVFLTPPIWKRLADIPAGKEHKDLARTRAIARWPAHADLFARKCDIDRGEAALIGWAGLQWEAGR
jgi:hypothetical protein